MQNSERILKDVLATLVYYDGMDYPMTAFEIWKYLMRADYYEAESKAYGKVSLKDIIWALEHEKNKEWVERKNGFYFLRGRADLTVQRIERGKISAGKFKRLRRIAWFLRLVPFVRMVGVTGRLAMKNAEVKSDWDVLIVLKKGHIWLGRFLVTAVVHILGSRRYGNKVTDRVCLNYYITDKTLEIATKDLFSANEYFFLFPLFGFETYCSFSLRNLWIRKIKPNYNLEEIAPLKIFAATLMTNKIQSWGEYLLQNSCWENICEKIEKRKIMQNPKTYQEGGLVFYSSEALIFLPKPHGPVMFEKFKKKMGEMQS